MELERIIKERCEAKQEEDMACSAGMDSVTDVQCVRENSITVERVEKLGRERSVSERLIKVGLFNCAFFLLNARLQVTVWCFLLYRALFCLLPCPLRICLQ